MPQKKYSLEDMQKVAEERGGYCLSKEYSYKKLEWMCEKGHTWKTTPDNIINKKTWCPHCAGKFLTINDMKDLADKYKGECLSLEYINSKTKLKWRCRYGHIFEAQPNCVQQGTWCRKCASIKNIQ